MMVFNSRWSQIIFRFFRWKICNKHHMSIQYSYFHWFSTENVLYGGLTHFFKGVIVSDDLNDLIQVRTWSDFNRISLE